jgi:hypothetical protein
MFDALYSDARNPTKLRSNVAAVTKRVTLLMSRFFPAVAALLAAYADAHMSGTQNAVILGLVVGAMMTPQVLDLGHTRRLTVEAGLKTSPADKERQIHDSFRAFLLLSIFISVVISAVALGTIASVRQQALLLVTMCLTVSVAGALIQLNIALLYFRGIPNPFLSALIDPVFIIIFSICLYLEPVHSPILLSIFLLLRSIAALIVAKYMHHTIRIALQFRLAIITLWSEARNFGHLEVKLSLFCFVAWAIDPLLYGFFPVSAGASDHLMATRFSQIAINLTNVFLVGAIWRLDSVTKSSTANVQYTLALIIGVLGIISAVTLLKTYNLECLTQSLMIYTVVFFGTIAAIARQRATLALLSLGVDMRGGVSFKIIVGILALKMVAVSSHNIVLLEIASVSASYLYLRRLSRNA